MKKLILIIVSVLFFTGCQDVNKPLHDKFEAYYLAEDFIKGKLKSPSTAEFPGISEKQNHVTEIDSVTFKIASWVDSQNGFGATVRTKFFITVNFNDETQMVNYTDFLLLE